MENDELKKSWQELDTRLEQAGKTSRQTMATLISTRAVFRVFLMKARGMAGILLSPAVFIFILIPLFFREEYTVFFVLGSVVISATFLFGLVMSVQYLRLLQRIRPAFDPVVRTTEQVLALRRFMVRLRKVRNWFYPLTGAAFGAVFWNRLPFETPVRAILLILFALGIYVWGNLKYRFTIRDQMNSIDAELEELSHYQ